MKKVLRVPLLMVFHFLSLCSNGQSVWQLDSNHSQLAFAIALLNITDVEGTFKIKEATISATKDDFSDAALNMRADTKSINTGIEQRDAHLRTADFFDAEKYPSISFRSTTFKKTGEGKYKVTGDLSMHGITRQVILDATAKTIVHPVTKQAVAGFRVSGIVKRSDFGISPATPPDMLSDEVIVRANVQFEKK
jgi:polyisoprenoid-binding protein YceI